MKNNLQVAALFEEEPEGGYTVTVPSVPGCVSYGRTLEEAKKNIGDALKLHLACLKAHTGKAQTPKPKNIFTAILKQSSIPLQKK